MYVQIPTRDTDDPNASADINQAQDNLDAIKGGVAATPPTTTVETLKANKLAIADIDDTPADDADVPVSSKWIYDNIFKAFKAFTSIEKTVDYTILDNDGYVLIRVGDTDNSRTITLPTAADNLDRIIEVRNNNAFTYGGGSDNSQKITVDGEGAETLDYLGVQQTTIDFEFIGSGGLFQSNGTSWDILKVFGGEIENIGGTLEMIYTKFFQGTTDGDTGTEVAHGVADYDKILNCTGFIYSDNTSNYIVYDKWIGLSADNAFELRFDGTNILLVNVGVNNQSNNYRLKIEYYF